MAQEYKISVPKWVLDDRTPIQSKRMMSITISDEDGSGTLTKGDTIATHKRNGDVVFHDRSVLKKFGISNEVPLDLKFAQAYFGRVRQVARKAARGKVTGEQVIDALLPRLETKGADYLDAQFGIRGIDHAAGLAAKVRAGAIEYRHQQYAEATRLKKEMLSLYAGRSSGNPQAAARYWKVSAQARELFMQMAATTRDPIWNHQVEWVFKMDQKAYGQVALRKYIPAKHEVYLANLGKIDKMPGFKTQQKMRQDAARAAYEKLEREQRLAAEFESL